MNKKQKLIIVEGGQGVGKTTLTNYLREQISPSTLLRLSGCKSNDISMIYDYHKYFLYLCEELGVNKVDNNIIFDRSFFSEWVYRRLGYKGDYLYAFNDSGWGLSGFLDTLTDFYDVVLIPLYLDNVEEYADRLKRDKPTYNDIKFDADKSMKQQYEYLKLCNEVVKTFPSIKLVAFNSKKEYKQLLEILEGM